MKTEKRILSLRDIVPILIIVIISSFIIFSNLGGSFLHAYDESRHAQNALEMVRTGDLVVNYYLGEPDMYNFKPPLGTYLIAISFILFGISEFSVRLFSAISAILMLITVYLIGKELEDRLVGFFASMMMLIMPTFLLYHGARTGDYDILVNLFLALSVYFYILYKKRNNWKFLIGTSIAIGLGFMAKGFFGFLIVPILALDYFITVKKKISLKQFWILVLSTSLIILPWLITRMIRGVDFIRKMFFRDVYVRFTNTIEGHDLPWDIYITLISENIGLIFSVLFLISLIFILLKAKKQNNLLLLFWFFIPLVVFTLSETRIRWYAIPLFAPLALITSIGVRKITLKINWSKILFCLIFIILLYNPLIVSYQWTEYSYKPNSTGQLKEMSHMLEDYDYAYVLNFWRQDIVFYSSSFVKKYAIVIRDGGEFNTQQNSVIITLDEAEYNRINGQEKYELLERKSEVAIFVQKDSLLN